jgi:NADH-quinone oxidoreductase subunit C
MSELLEQAAKAISERFGAEDLRFRNEITLMLKPEHLLEAAQVLRNEYSFDVLLDETAVDYWPQETPRFHVIYQLRSSKANVLLRLRVPLDGNAPHIETIEKIYPAANWKEREIWDLMGITFDGHSDPRASCCGDGSDTRCAKITRSVTKRFSSPSIKRTWTAASPTPKNNQEGVNV